ncbi:MAG: hypothetical protein K5752_03540 [Succinivibrionaceae bacterium]|nr:hypothetical protein [Succinivibrionaceae bacterium]
MAKKEVPATDRRTVISVSLSAEDKKALKILAAEKETSVSGLISEWIATESKKTK